MWQIFTLGALIFNAAETTTDKIIMVADKALDTLVISFYRNLVFFSISLLIGITGIVGTLHFALEWPIIVVSLFELMGSIFYTILLKKVEMSGAAAISYITPFLFLITDIFVIKAPLTNNQILGILLLITGGIIFIIDPSTKHLKQQYSKYILAILCFDAVRLGIQYYAFKYYSADQNLNEISYIVSVWFWVSLGLFLMVIFKKKIDLLYSTATHKHYLAKIMVSKSFDVGSALLWFHALSLTTVSQVNSFSAFEPLILLAILVFAQQVLKFKAGEDFTIPSLFQKIIATVILVIGAWFTT